MTRSLLLNASGRVSEPYGPVARRDQVELATLPWVGWWNQRRLHGALDHIPPAEHEALYYRQLEQPNEAA